MERAPLAIMGRKCESRYLGMVDYGEALRIQSRLVESRKAGEIPDQLLFVEHPHVITLGRRADDTDILVSNEKLRALGIRVYRVGRGGRATYHGPGQLVCYPIIDLRGWGGPRDYVNALEEILIRTLCSYGVTGERKHGHAGVWVNGSKIGAIGVRIAGGFTSHGFSINVYPDLDLFKMIVPCGIVDLPVTSLEALIGKRLLLEQVALCVAREFECLITSEM